MACSPCCAVRQQDSRASPALAACLVCIRGLTLGGERCDTEMSDGARVVSPGIGWRRCARVRNTVVKTPSARKRRGVIGSTHDFWTYRALSSLQTSHGFNRGRAVSRGSRLTIFSMGCRAAPGLAPGRSLGFRCAHAAARVPGLGVCAWRGDCARSTAGGGIVGWWTVVFRLSPRHAVCVAVGGVRAPDAVVSVRG